MQLDQKSAMGEEKKNKRGTPAHKGGRTRGASTTHKEEIVSIASDWGPIVQSRPVLSTDSRFLVVTSGHTVKVLSTDSGKLVEEHLYHKHMVIGVQQTKEGEDEYMSCDESGLVCVWKLLSKDQDDVKKYRLKLRHFDGVASVVDFVFCRATREVFVVIASKNFTGGLFKYSEPYDGIRVRRKLMQRYVRLGQCKIAVSGSGKTVVICSVKRIFVLQNRDLHSTKEKKPWMVHKIQPKHPPTCIVYHPTKDIVAIGDTMGRLVLWYEFTSPFPRKQKMHWHELPVGHLAFNKTGTELYSGGSESVLVKWQLSSEKRYFLPRLGMPIRFITLDETNTLIAVSHVDNGISIINAQSLKLSGLIQGFALNVNHPNPFSAGIVYDPRTRAVVTNSKTGHVQFYDIHQRRLLYHVNITLCNYYTQEQHQKIENTEVQLVALSPNGYWMATTEHRRDIFYTQEIRLKFWMFDKMSQTWLLNTSIDMPHQQAMNGLAFQCAPDKQLFCVTCSKDRKFKIWEEIDTSDVYGSKSSWSCVGVGSYRNLPATSITISPDGSLLAVSFSSIVTLWEPSPCQLKGSLSQPYLNKTILQVEFGRGEGCRSLLVTRSYEWLCVWSLLTCSLQWRVSLRSTCLAADPLSQYMAIFSAKGDLFIFDPRNSKFVSVQENIILTEKPLAAAFIPRVQKSDNTSFWNYHSSLHYISSSQSLQTLEVTRDLNSANEKIGEEVRKLVLDTEGPPPALTPFAALLAPIRTSHKAKTKEKEAASADFGVKLEKSTLFIQKVLDEARIYKLDSFSHLASAFCKMILPEAETSEEKLQQEEVKIKRQKEEIFLPVKKIKKAELQKVADTDFSDLMELLAL